MNNSRQKDVISEKMQYIADKKTGKKQKGTVFPSLRWYNFMYALSYSSISGGAGAFSLASFSAFR
jgi:hypothetical protein